MIVFAVLAATSRKHRVVLAGTATGLVLHFARDIAEGPPGVRMLWPLQQNAWTASYWWFLGMIVAFTAARLILASGAFPWARMSLHCVPFHHRFEVALGDIPGPPQGPLQRRGTD